MHTDTPEQVNWKAVPFVILIFVLFGGTIFGSFSLAQSQGWVALPPPPHQTLLDSGGAAFADGRSHLPARWADGPYLMVLRDGDTTSVTFANGPACAAAAAHLTNPRTGGQGSASCHPTGG